MMYRARYLASTPFSHRQERATTKLALTYPCPTPYAAKVALIVGAIRAGLNPEGFTKQIRDAAIQPHPWGQGVVNTHMVKHWEPPHSDSKGKLPPAFLSSTVTFREYVHFERGGVDLYFPEEARDWLEPALIGVNTFGKQGSLFALLSLETKDPPKPTVHLAASDMQANAKWEKVSNFTGSKNKGNPRDTAAWLHLATRLVSAGTTYQHYDYEVS